MPGAVVRPFVDVAAIAAVMAGALCTTVDCQPQDDPWQQLRPLVGAWEGTGSGFGTISSVSHRWEFVIGNSFLRLLTRSVSAGEDGIQEVHEDVGYVSYDADRETFVFRQFLSEGYVNVYELIVSTDGTRIDFGHREVEGGGGMRAQMRIVFASDSEYEMVLDLAAPGEEFVPCQEMVMRRRLEERPVLRY